MKLQDYLLQTEEVSAYDLADAQRRAQIYGGSVDTALLELEVIEPSALDAALAAARGLLACPPELLVQTSQRRPWDMLPTAWIDDLDAVPLAVIEDRLWVALHPEVTDEAISSVQSKLPGAALTITAECWIRMIGDQHRKTITPPRYASLAARYLHAIRSARDHLTEESLTRDVTEVHQAFMSEASGFFPVDDDALESPQEDAAAPGPAPDKTPAPAPRAHDRTKTAQLAALAQIAALGDSTTRDSDSTTSDSESSAGDSQLFAPVIPGLRRAPAEPSSDEAQDRASDSGTRHALGESPPFIPALLQEQEQEPETPAPSPVMPSLRKSRVEPTVIPSLKRPGPAQIPDLTRRTDPPQERADEAKQALAKADEGAASEPQSAAIIPALQRTPAAQEPAQETAQENSQENSQEPAQETAEPDSPTPRRRERSSGYVPQTLIHRKAQASTTIDLLVSSAIAAGGRRPDHTARLRELGEAAFIRIAQLFPGPLDLPRSDLKSLPTASAHGPLLRLCIALGDEVTPYILARLDDPDANVRFYVALVFQELRSAAAVSPLARLAFDPDRDVRTIAMRVLETYHDDPSYSRAAQGLRRELTSSKPQRRHRAIQAMGTLRDVDAISKLIDALEDELEIAAAALTALCSISGQHLGMGSASWRQWHQDNGGRSRIDWMIDSLEHRDPAVRRWAAEELLRITTVDIPFDPHGEEAERGEAIARWRAWAQTSKEV